MCGTDLRRSPHRSRAGLLSDHPVGWLSLCWKWPNTEENSHCIDGPTVKTSIGHTLFQTRPDQERGIIGQASLLLGWHWVLFSFTPPCLEQVELCSSKWLAWNSNECPGSSHSEWCRSDQVVWKHLPSCQTGRKYSPGLICLAILEMPYSPQDKGKVKLNNSRLYIFCIRV